MGSRALQLAVIVTLGAIFGLLITRPWRGGDTTDVVAAEPVAGTSAASAVAATSPSVQTGTDNVPPPPTRTFKLPTLAVTEVRSEKAASAPEDPPVVLVPKDWLLRGTGPQHYNVKSDRSEVFSGVSSVMMAAFDKRDVPVTQTASLMQSVMAGPWVDQRVVFSVNWKGRQMRQRVELWIRALDAEKTVVAYNSTQSLYAKPEWRRSTVAIDVPASATEIAYGISLGGVGGLWVDAAHLDSIDKAVPMNMPATPSSELGVVAESASTERGPLLSPSNMDFEDVTESEFALGFREDPKGAVARRRF